VSISGEAGFQFFQNVFVDNSLQVGQGDARFGLSAQAGALENQRWRLILRRSIEVLFRSDSVNPPWSAITASESGDSTAAGSNASDR
jgi:hypothetical protein